MIEVNIKLAGGKTLLLRTPTEKDANKTMDAIATALSTRQPFDISTQHGQRFIIPAHEILRAEKKEVTDDVGQ